MTLYRNVNTGDVFDTEADSSNKESVAWVESLDNWKKVSKADSEKPFLEWSPPTTGFVDAPEVSGALEDGLVPRDGKPGPVDVPQSGPTGSKARGNLAPDKKVVPANTDTGNLVTPGDAEPTAANQKA